MNFIKIQIRHKLRSIVSSLIWTSFIFGESENLSFPKCPTFVLRVETYWDYKTVLLERGDVEIYVKNSSIYRFFGWGRGRVVFIFN